MDQEYNQVGVNNIEGAIFWLIVNQIINPYTNAITVGINCLLLLCTKLLKQITEFLF